MYVDLFLVGIPVNVGVEHTHASVFEEEVVDVELGIGAHLAERRHDDGSSRCVAVELHGVEVDEVEHVFHIHGVEVDEQRVGVAV